jgi:hypothetical protein
MNLPEAYVIEKFYQYSGYPRYKKSNNSYEAGCPICREGNSWNKKRRLYYLPESGVMCCHNCGWYSNTMKWVLEVSGLTYNEIVNEIKANEFNVIDISTETVSVSSFEVESLPKDSINLLSKQQVDYYHDNKIVQQAVQYIKSRKLDTAVNAPPAIYLSLTDSVHKNRVCLPSYDTNNKVVYYQTRSFLENDDRPKYLSKINSPKNVYGIENVTDIHKYIYLFEGPIDSFFIENGVAIYGIQENSTQSLTEYQRDILSKYYYMNTVWVLDNQHIDTASREKTKLLLDRGENVFIWPRSLSKFKDFNEMCMKYNLDEIDHKFIESRTFSGSDAKMQLMMN